jgi:hypothetical protein
MDPADRPVLREPALPRSIDQPVALGALWPSHPLEYQPTQTAPYQISRT